MARVSSRFSIETLLGGDMMTSPFATAESERAMRGRKARRTRIVMTGGE
jgi:hypothetical protein